MITYLSWDLHNQTRRYPTVLIHSVSIAVIQGQKTLARKAYLTLALQGLIAASSRFGFSFGSAAIKGAFAITRVVTIARRGPCCQQLQHSSFQFVSIFKAMKKPHFKVTAASTTFDFGWKNSFAPSSD